VENVNRVRLIFADMITKENNSIRILPDFIANQIAAGEVVQRPESVVKEIVENSLDAGATSILVNVKDAGKKLIHIIDNGRGMKREDLELSVRRHATSKIFSQEDLESILTFGFRGEALASICSVADVEIRTRQESDNHGWKLISEPGRDISIEPVNTEIGTQIFVRNLFYNVPARKKFLRSNLTEFRYISDTMIKFVLSNLNTRFTFYDDENLIFDLYPSGMKERIENSLGAGLSENLLEINDDSGNILISGYVGKPDVARQNKSSQYFFLNGRSIQNRSLNHAVYVNFENLIDKGKHPVFVINLKLDPRSVDINVHPQKHEVKFEDERSIYNQLNFAVAKLLKNHHFIPEVSILSRSAQSPFERINPSNSGDNFLVNKFTGELLTHGSENESGRNSFSGKFDSGYRDDYKPGSFDKSAFDLLFGKDSNQADVKLNHDDTINSYKFIGVLLDHYILASAPGGMYIIDKSLAHQRLILTNLKNGINRNNPGSQQLLFPIDIRLEPRQINLIQSVYNEFLNIGFSWECYPGHIALLSVPDIVPSGREDQLLTNIIAQMEREESFHFRERMEDILMIIARTSAYRRNDSISSKEAESLLSGLFSQEEGFSLPGGKSCILKVNSWQIENFFK
jgi:DNA mismatch repair protein MutL